jgi:hypothetical protein
MQTETETTESSKTDTSISHSSPSSEAKNYEDFYNKAVADNVKLRAKNNELKTLVTQLEPEAQKSAELAEQLSKEASTKQQLVARTEFKARLRQEGINDPDVLKLFDLSQAKVTDDGDVENADELWESFKTAKPYLFGSKSSGEDKTVNTSTSSTAKAPKPNATTGIDWSTATDEEVRAAQKPSRYFK